MAGIEKICEYSGDYPGCIMYKWKYNHIQVCTKYRDYFRGKSHCLYIFNGIQRFNWIRDRFDPVEYPYFLHVPDEPGIVTGTYWNYTHQLDHTLFNLWELMGRTVLKVRFVYNMDSTAFEYFKEFEDTNAFAECNDLYTYNYEYPRLKPKRKKQCK
jgi:hypothetical protein